MLGKDAFHSVNFRQMENLLVGHGTCKNHYIYNGKNGIVRVTAGTTAWLTERKKESYLTLTRSNIMVNGHSSVFMGYRFVAIVAIHLCFHLKLVSSDPKTFFKELMLSFYLGTCLCGFLSSQSCNAFLWLGILFHSFAL